MVVRWNFEVANDQYHGNMEIRFPGYDPGMVPITAVAELVCRGCKMDGKLTFSSHVNFLIRILGDRKM